jgi:hypothetical protein
MLIQFQPILSISIFPELHDSEHFYFNDFSSISKVPIAELSSQAPMELQNLFQKPQNLAPYALQRLLCDLCCKIK